MPKKWTPPPLTVSERRFIARALRDQAQRYAEASKNKQNKQPERAMAALEAERYSELAIHFYDE